MIAIHVKSMAIYLRDQERQVCGQLPGKQNHEVTRSVRQRGRQKNMLQVSTPWSRFNAGARELLRLLGGRAEVYGAKALNRLSDFDHTRGQPSPARNFRITLGVSDSKSDATA